MFTGEAIDVVEADNELSVIVGISVDTLNERLEVSDVELNTVASVETSTLVVSRKIFETDEEFTETSDDVSVATLSSEETSTVSVDCCSDTETCVEACTAMFGEDCDDVLYTMVGSIL